MAGSPLFSIEPSDNFKRSFKKIAKSYGSNFTDLIAKILEDLIKNPYPLSSRAEPLPGKVRLGAGWQFRKLEIRLGRGGSGQLRLMYLVNGEAGLIRLVWLYSHEQFKKRPPDADLKAVLTALLDDGSDS